MFTAINAPYSEFKYCPTRVLQYWSEIWKHFDLITKPDKFFTKLASAQKPILCHQGRVWFPFYCCYGSHYISIILQFRHASEQKNIQRFPCLRYFYFPLFSCSIVLPYFFSNTDGECVLFVFMHMNSIRWMPMIRWLKFPFRVHFLHKTVQLSVCEQNVCENIPNSAT